MNRSIASTMLFVYGTLLDATVRVRLLGREVASMPAALPNYARARGRYFFVQKSDGSMTPGLILVGLTARDFVILDQYEETPTLYTRELITVRVGGANLLRCWVYLPTPMTLALH